MNKIQEKENFPFLDQIVSSIYQSKLTSDLVDLVQIQSTPSKKQFSSQSCSKHNNKKGDYFQTEYPWIKFCQACALNLALCGKKIQKSLSSDQMFTKITLCDTLQSVNQAIKKSQNSHNQLSFISSELQNCRQQFVSLVTDIDTFISKLTSIKNELQQNIQTYFTVQIKHLIEKQSLLVSKKIELINKKSKIECGFLQMIGQGSQQLNTLNVIAECKNTISQALQLLVKNDLKICLAQNVRNVQRIFSQKIEQINCSKLVIQDQQFNNKVRNENLSISSKFSHTLLKETKYSLTDESEIQQIQGGCITTCSTTLQNSGLVTPSERNQMPLQELSQNKRNSRATLQLKARCRSKSGQRKIQVNVRQQKQKRARVNAFV